MRFRRRPRRVCRLRLSRPTSVTSPSFIVATSELGIDGIAIICRRAGLGSYEVTALIGQGGMGEVWRNRVIKTIRAFATVG